MQGQFNAWHVAQIMHSAQRHLRPIHSFVETAHIYLAMLLGKQHHIVPALLELKNRVWIQLMEYEIVPDVT